MDFQFAITISEHRILGFVFAPYLVRKEKNQDCLTIYDRVTLATLPTYESLLTPEQIQLVKHVEDYNDGNLFKVFSKRKKNSRDFMASITTDMLTNHIRPYVERRMAKCLEILRFNPVPVYHKILQNNVYQEDRIEIIREEASAVFNFDRREEGFKYFLSVEYGGQDLKLTGKEGLIIVNEPCCLILDDKMFVFEDIDGKKLLPFFEKEYVQVPPASEKKYLETFVRNAIRKYKVNATGFEITDEDAKPRAALSVEKDLAGQFYLVLKFIYNSKSIYYANRKTDIKVSLEQRNGQFRFIRLKRDYDRENAIISDLLSMGLVNKEGPNFLPLKKGNDPGGSGYQIINWVNFNSRFIREAGIDIAQDKLDKLYYLDDFQVNMEVSEKKNDWFDIEARVEFAGFKIPFASFHPYILKGQREYLLPDGRIMILPDEWFEDYRDMLSFSRIEKDRIRLDKQHFPLLNKNIRGISGRFKQGLLELVKSDVKPEPIPSGIEANLRNYQIEGYSWLYRLHKNGFGGCLADDMGLGKTLQTLTLLNRVISEIREIIPAEQDLAPPTKQLSLFDSGNAETRKRGKASLIIVPTSLVHNWLNESEKFVPGLIVNTYIGANRKDPEELINNSDLLITTYGIVRNEIEKFSQFEFLYLILDESQMIKNPGAKTYQAIIQLHAENRLVLTGTPIENSLSDMWAQINFLNPGLLGSLAFFQSQFMLPIEKHGDELKQEKLLKLISPFVLRRSKSEVAPELPPVNEQVIYCDMDDRQEAYYEREKSKARNLVLERMSQKGFNQSAVVILQSLTRLRQIANHPALVDETYFSESGKYNEITRNLHSLKTEGHKVLVFSSFAKHLDLVGDHLDNQSIPYARLTGETTNREAAIKKFQEDDNCPFFLISLKAGGVGLNLTSADYVFILDPWWNPAAEMQAISRAHRIGQDKHVFVYRFISRGTLEEKILKLQEKKSTLADAFVNNSLRGITQDQVMDLFE